jgi:putative colanic acid biosynthesis acetyltransferase WcaF
VIINYEGPVRLDRYGNAEFDRGASKLKEFTWMLVQAFLVGTWIPGSGWRVVLLRLFGAKIGQNVYIKPTCKVKFPWKLEIGEWTWIGEGVWIDNLAKVRIGAHCCVSQGAYFCTGNHNWKVESFDLITEPIVVHDHAWIGAMSRLSPGTIVGRRAILSLGSVAVEDLVEDGIYRGNPANLVKTREHE